jgi:hypothetical protein
MDALDFIKGTDTVFQKTQRQYADMQGFVTPLTRQGTVMAGSGYHGPDTAKPTMDLPPLKFDAGKVGTSVDPTRQTPTTSRYEGGYDAADHQAAADIPGFGTAGWTDIGPVGRAAMTMAEALPGIGAVAKAAGMGLNMSNVTYANTVREQMGLEKLDALAQFNAVMGFNSYGKDLGAALGMDVDTSGLSQSARDAVTSTGFGSSIGGYNSASFGNTPSLTETFSGFGLGAPKESYSPGKEAKGAGFGFGSSAGPDTARGEAVGTGGWDGYGGFGGYTSESPGTAGGGGGEDGNNGAGSW